MNENKKTDSSNNFNQYLTFSYKKKDKSNLKVYDEEISANEKLLRFQMVYRCSELCFGNLNCDFLSVNEQMCLIDCFKKYSDTLFLADKILDKINDGKISKINLLKGDFSKFTEEILKTPNI